MRRTVPTPAQPWCAAVRHTRHFAYVQYSADDTTGGSAAPGLFLFLPWRACMGWPGGAGPSRAVSCMYVFVQGCPVVVQ